MRDAQLCLAGLLLTFGCLFVCLCGCAYVRTCADEQDVFAARVPAREARCSRNRHRSSRSSSRHRYTEASNAVQGSRRTHSRQRHRRRCCMSSRVTLSARLTHPSAQESDAGSDGAFTSRSSKRAPATERRASSGRAASSRAAQQLAVDSDSDADAVTVWRAGSAPGRAGGKRRTRRMMRCAAWRRCVCVGL